MSAHAISRLDRAQTVHVAPAASFTSPTANMATSLTIGDAVFWTRRDPTNEYAAFPTVEFIFFGTATANDPTTIAFFVWQQNDQRVWFRRPVGIAEFVLDAGVSGLAGQVPSNTQKFASFITADIPKVVVPSDSGPAVLYVPTLGCDIMSMGIAVGSTSLGFERTLCGIPFEDL